MPVISNIDVTLNSTNLTQSLGNKGSNKVTSFLFTALAKGKSLCGFAPEMKGEIELRDYNKDGESIMGLTVAKHQALTLRNKKGKVVYQSARGEKVVNTLKLPSGTYSYLVQG